jgi:hypothetical protein
MPDLAQHGEAWAVAQIRFLLLLLLRVTERLPSRASKLIIPIINPNGGAG